MDSIPEIEEAAYTQSQIDGQIPRLGHSQISRPSCIPAPQSRQPLTEEIPHEILPLNREWTRFPRSLIVDRERLGLKYRHTASGRQHRPQETTLLPHHSGDVGNGLECEVTHKRKRDSLGALPLKLVNKIKILIAKAKSS